MPNSSVISAPYAAYALDLLAQILEGFPVKYAYCMYTQQDVELARKWMSEQKAFKIIR